MVNIHRDEVTQPASISDAICGLCKFKNLLNVNFNKIMIIMIMIIIMIRNHKGSRMVKDFKIS